MRRRDSEDHLSNFLEVEPFVYADGCVADRRYPGFSDFKKLIPLLLGKSVTLSDALCCVGYTNHLHDDLLVEAITSYLWDRHRVTLCETSLVWVRVMKNPNPVDFAIPCSRPVWEKFDKDGFKLREQGVEYHDASGTRKVWNQDGHS